MADQLGFRQIRLTLNGHVFQKWSDADPPITFEKLDMLDFTYGRDGALYVNDKAMKGGTMDVSLLPTSPSAVRVLRWFTQRQNDRQAPVQRDVQRHRHRLQPAPSRRLPSAVRPE